jgi:thiamine pyrophosphokinase
MENAVASGGKSRREIPPRMKAPGGGSMRGIAFIGGEGPPAGSCGGLAKGAALVVAADSGLAAAEAAGIKPDWIVGDMDSLDDPRRLEKYPAGRIIPYPADKDFTDTELALRLLWERGCGETWLVGGGGGRMDHLLALRALFERDPAPDRWLTAAEDIRCLREDRGNPLCPGMAPGEPALPPGSLVSVFPLGGGPWRLESRGLRWPLDDLVWDRGFYGISNVAPEGCFSLLARRGKFLVILPLRE